MPKFHVQIGRTATVYHSAVIEADSLEDLTKESGKYFDGLTDDWKKDGQDDPEVIEVVNILDADGEKPLSRWTDMEGWEE
jgi:hypothetical protein